MSNLMSENTFRTIIHEISGANDIENFMLAHKETFKMLHPSIRNHIVKHIYEHHNDVASIFEKMQHSNNVQLNEALFASIVNWFFHNWIDHHSFHIFNEFLSIHHNEHKTCNDKVMIQIINILCSDKKFDLEEHVLICYDDIQNEKKLTKFFDMISKMKIICLSPYVDDVIIKCMSTLFDYVRKMLGSKSPNSRNFYDECNSRLILELSDEDWGRYFKELFLSNLSYKVERLCDGSKQIKSDCVSEGNAQNEKTSDLISLSDAIENDIQNDEQHSKHAPPLSKFLDVYMRSTNFAIESHMKENYSDEQHLTISDNKIDIKSERWRDVYDCELKSDQLIIICKYARNDEHAETLHVKSDNDKFDVIVEYLKSRWMIDESEIQISRQEMSFFTKQYQLYDDANNNLIVLMSNDDGPIFNFVYTA